MTALPDREPTIIRTERGLSISGTRITLYDVMDYLLAEYPARFICSLFNLTEAQMNVALAYIETHRDDVDAEYQMVLEQAEESRRYWEERNRDRLARIAKMSPTPGREALWEKLQAQKAKHAQEARSFSSIAISKDTQRSYWGILRVKVG